MWFKNLRAYSIAEKLPTFAEFDECFASQSLKPVAKSAQESYGWVSPLGPASNILVHACNGHYLVCACKEERVLPSAVIQEFLQDKVREIEDAEGRKLSRKQRQQIKDELILDLLPKAFTRKVKTYAYIDAKNEYLYVDTTNANRAEAVIALLRETFGSFIATPVQTNESVSAVLTDWVLNNKFPEQIVIESQCEMVDTLQEGGTIKCNNQEVQSEEVCQHLRLGKRIKQLALTWNDAFSLTLDQDFVFKRIRPLDVIVSARKDIQADSDIEQIDADFALMTLEYAQLMSAFIAYMGGEMEPETLGVDLDGQDAA